MNVKQWEHDEECFIAPIDSEGRFLPFPELPNTFVTLADHEAELAKYRRVLRAILDADERGQGLPFKEAMDEATRLLNA